MARPAVSSAQCRSGRALLRWSQAQLAAEAFVARKTITDYESGHRFVHYRTRRAITEALQRAGVTFTWDEGEGTALVRPRTRMPGTEAQPQAPTNLIVVASGETD